MMDLDDIKRGLRAEIKKRENEQYFTFQCNIRQMCKDVLAKLEEQESEIAELKRKDTEHTVQIAKMNGYISHLEDVLEHHGIVLPKGHEFVMNNPTLPSAPKEDK